MKILITQKIDGFAGSENYLIRLAHGLTKRNIKFGFLLLYSDPKKTKLFKSKILTESITLHEVKLSSLFSLRAYSDVKEIIDENGYDIIHSNLLLTDLFCSFFKRFFCPRIILVSGKHGYEEKYTNKYGFKPNWKGIGKYWLAAKIAESNINKSFAITNGISNLFIGLDIVKPSKIEVIPYGFDFVKKGVYDKKLRFSKYQMVIVGRLTSYKGHRFAFEALKLLKGKYREELKLIICWKRRAGKRIKRTGLQYWN